MDCMNAPAHFPVEVGERKPAITVRENRFGRG
jgi:hypothetical protein